MTKRTDDNFFHWVNDEHGHEFSRHVRQRSVAITFVYFLENLKWAIYKRMIRYGSGQNAHDATEKITQKIREVLNI